MNCGGWDSYLYPQRIISLNTLSSIFPSGQLFIFLLKKKKKALNYVKEPQLSLAFRASKLRGTYSVVRVKYKCTLKSPLKNSSAPPSLAGSHRLKQLPEAEQCLFQETANKHTVSGQVHYKVGQGTCKLLSEALAPKLPYLLGANLYLKEHPFSFSREDSRWSKWHPF